MACAQKIPCDVRAIVRSHLAGKYSVCVEAALKKRKTSLYQLDVNEDGIAYMQGPFAVGAADEYKYFRRRFPAARWHLAECAKVVKGRRVVILCTVRVCDKGAKHEARFMVTKRSNQT